jgi:diphthamide synthase (EF-2-diphthine--ammonia ligase)
METLGLTPVFPIFGLPTAQLARDMIAGGLRAVITCVDTKQLDASFSGRAFDSQLLADLPEGVDHCGENGEFHTLVTAGPMFGEEIAISPGEEHEAGQFLFRDFLPRG